MTQFQPHFIVYLLFTTVNGDFHGVILGWASCLDRVQSVIIGLSDIGQCENE